MLKEGSRYTKSDLYQHFAVPTNKQKGSWNTGYLKYNNEIFIFANIGVAGRTGHDYNNFWKDGDLVWYGKTNSHIGQPLIKFMLQPKTKIHLFTRENDRDSFTYQGLSVAKSVDQTKKPIEITWGITKEQQNTTAVPGIKNEVEEAALSKNIKQAKDDDISNTIWRKYRQRKEQNKFSENLHRVYGGRCCITGCTVKAVLNACHIIPHAQAGNNNTTNGVLLRSDIHDLFDMQLIGIHPATLKVHIKKELENTEYASLEGKTLLPRLLGEPTNKEALEKRWQLFTNKHG